MKVPEEIKKGLEFISDDVCGVCSECPYRRAEECREQIAVDALEYIQQLELDKQQLEGLCSHMKQLCDAAAGRVLKMEAEIDRQRERIRVLELSLQAVNDGNAALQRENLMLEAQVPRWISMEEKKPPRHMGEYLCWCALDDDPEHKWDWAMVLRWHAIDGNGIVDRPHFTDEGVNGMYVTHWMPLPEGPKEDD